MSGTAHVVHQKIVSSMSSSILTKIWHSHSPICAQAPIQLSEATSKDEIGVADMSIAYVAVVDVALLALGAENCSIALNCNFIV